MSASETMKRLTGRAVVDVRLTVVSAVSALTFADVGSPPVLTQAVVSAGAAEALVHILAAASTFVEKTKISAAYFQPISHPLPSLVPCQPAGHRQVKEE